jgi:NAD(P)-dependent dehydrogenase (short-subunit alcohol dehydrogenase family)
VAVAPGPVLLPPLFTPEQTEDTIQRTLLKRLGEPGDVSRMIAFLIEQEFLTGHVYFVDGGQLFSH